MTTTRQRLIGRSHAAALMFVVAVSVTSHALLPSAFIATAHAQSDGIVEQLIARARGWQTKGRMDKAVEAWQKVLLSQPQNAEALEAIGLWHANAGREQEAKAMLKSLEAVAAGSVGVARLRAALRLGKDFDSHVKDARTKVREGKLAEAAATYEQAFGGAAPPEHLALEYYQTLGGTDAGWERARVGLEAFVASHPQRIDARLALAQHLSYRETTRRDAIEMLRALSQERAAHDEAVSAWLKALLWLRVSTTDAARLRAYLDEVGPDAQVSARLKALTSTTTVSPKDTSVRAGYEALDRDDTDEASRMFQRAGDGPEALVGLALTAMRKEDFDLAITLLEKAGQGAPTRTDLWRKPLASARFWRSVKKAQALTAQKDYAQADSLLRDAIELSPEEAFHAHIALAQVLRAQGKLADAERELDEGLLAQPDEVTMLRTLVEIRIERESFEGALDANSHLIRLGSDKAFPEAELNAEVLRRRARKLRAAGALPEALGLLTESVKLAPSSYWAAYDLASLQLELGDKAAARNTLKQVLAIDAVEPTGRVLQARMIAEAGQLDAALALLVGMPDEAGDGEVGKLRKALTMRGDVDRVVRRSTALGMFGVQRELTALQRTAADDPELVGIVALGWADAGQPERGIDLVQDLLASRSAMDPGLSLLLAAIYLRAGMETPLRQLIEQLAGEPTLSPRARRDLARLHVAYAVSTADRLAQSGEYSRALSTLDPLLSEYPDDPALMSSLGRLLLQQGKLADASAAFEQVLRQHPDHVEAREGAVAAAQAANETQRAEQLVSEGLEITPNHPRMHLIAARQALARGKDAAAMKALERALGLAVRSEPQSAGQDHDELVPSDAAGLLARARARATDSAALEAGESTALIGVIETEIERIRDRHAVQLRTEPEMRYRRGQDGLGQLTEASAPIWFSIPLSYFGRLDIGATAVWLSAGTARLDYRGTAERFGTLAAVPGITLPRDQDDVGIAPGLAFLYQDVLRLSFGSTPLGFIYRDLVGSLELKPRWGSYSLTLKLERAPVTDSVLSYAGTTDPVTGNTWGGVIQQGGFAELSAGNHDLAFFLHGGFYLIDGRGIDANRMGRAMTGFDWTLHDWAGHKVTWGVSLLGMSYAENQSGFTLGHGGYFSPQLFARGGAPLQWHYEDTQLGLQLGIDPGLNWFRQERTPYYPSSPATQAALAAVSSDVDYEEKTSFGFSLNVGSELRYQLGSHFELGTRASMHFANDYEEYRALVFVQLSFRRRVQPAVTTE